jgi:putative salt-induced outer membrane protein YdiY
MKRTENDRLSLSYLFNYAEEEDHITARNHFGAMKYDYFYLKYIYGYLGLDVLNDRFRDIRMRTSIGPGVGYQIWEDSVKALGLEIGLSYLSESHYDNEDSDSWAMRLAGNLRYHMGSYLVITDQIVFYPTLEGNESNRVRNEATINAPLKAGWSMRCSHILDYSTSTPDDVKKTDTTVILGFQYQF